MAKSFEEQVQEVIMQYTGGKGLGNQNPRQDFQLSSNGRARMQETLHRRGIDRDSPEAFKTATLKALAEQRGQPEMNIGIDGRNGLSGSRGGVLVSKPLAERGNTGPDE